jgi:hypothetical protein
MVRRAVLGGLSALALASCGGVSGALTLDRSVEIVQPAPLEVVVTPFDIRWRGDIPSGTSFAVFIDRDPIAPGRSIADAFEDACDGAAGCPDEAFLSVRGVHLTDGHEVAVPLLTPRAGVDGAPALEVHRATIVVVDDDGVRQGERAWTTEFRVDR